MKVMEGAAELVPVVRCSGVVARGGGLLDIGGRLASSYTLVVRGGGLFWCHGGGGAHGQEVHVRAYGKREERVAEERRDLGKEMGRFGRGYGDFTYLVLSSSEGYKTALLLST